jgi:hypothetical protein
MTTRIAQWRPGWYELDQSIEVGLRAEFGFLADADPLVFHNTLWEPDCAVAAIGIIARITHDQLGSVRKVDARGLDYTCVLEDGRELIVNAEEEPGKLHERLDERWQPTPFQAEDWTLKVEFAELGPIGPAPVRLRSSL